MADETKQKRRSSQRISSRKTVSISKRARNEQHYSPYFKPSTESKKTKVTSNMVDLITKQTTHTIGNRLGRDFYDSYAGDLGRALIGKRIFRVLDDGEVLSGRIVETEGYLGETDPACHSYGGKRTTRTEAMYMLPGTSYVYYIYGMYFCLNISSKDIGGAVLIRALEPVDGIQKMSKLRSVKRNGTNKPQKVNDLCNGPSKLCQAMNITKDNLNKKDIVLSENLWIEDDLVVERDFKVVTSTRIGVNSYGQEAAQMLLRYYMLANKCVSVRDKTAEAQL